MNALERLTRTLAGERVSRPLNFDIVMAFAARHIGQPLSSYYRDHRVLCDANLAVCEAFALDIVQAISDPYRETADLGGEIDFPHDGLPLSRAPRLRTPSDLDTLRLVDPGSGRRMSDRISAVARFREQVGGSMPIMGWVEGALAEAADLRGVEALLTDLYDRPDWVASLLEFCTEQAIAFARAQVAAGADIIGLGDAIASQVSPRMYERYALPYERRIFDAVHALGAVARLHICGNTTRILALLPETGADIIDVDWMVDLHAARIAVGERVLCGNMNPVAVMLQGDPATVARETRACLAAGGARYISAAGCEIPDGTPAANLLAQAAVLADYVPS